MSEPGAPGEDPAEPLHIAAPDERHVSRVQPARAAAVGSVLHHHRSPGASPPPPPPSCTRSYDHSSELQDLREVLADGSTNIPSYRAT